MTSETRRFAMKHGDHHLKSVTIQGTNIHPSLLHNDNSSLSALQKGGGEEGSFAITSWRPPRTVFSTAHVFAGVLAATEEQAINTVLTHKIPNHELLSYYHTLILYYRDMVHRCLIFCWLRRQIHFTQRQSI